MVDIPTKEPVEFTNGETVQWYRNDLTDYPADTWTLTYNFRGASSQDVVAAASGTSFLITITATESAAFTAGDYWWQAFVTSGAERYQVDTGNLTVNPDLAAVDTDTYDGRSHVKIVFDALEAAYEGRASFTDSQVSVSTEHGSKAITHMTHEEISKALDDYRIRYKRELGINTKVTMRF